MVILYHIHTTNATKFLFCCVHWLAKKWGWLPNERIRAKAHKIMVVVAFAFLTPVSFRQSVRKQHITSRPCCQLLLQPLRDLRRRYFAANCASASAYIIVTVSLLWFSARRTFSISPYFRIKSTAYTFLMECGATFCRSLKASAARFTSFHTACRVWCFCGFRPGNTQYSPA